MERFTHPIKLAFSKFRFKKNDKPFIIEEKLNPFEKKQFSALRIFGFVSLIIAIIIMGLFAAYSSSKFLPETYIEEVRVGGLTIEEAISKVSKQYPTPPEHIIYLKFDVEEILEEEIDEIDNLEKNSLSESSGSADLAAYYDYEDQLKKVIDDQQKKPANWLIKLFFAPYSQEVHSLSIKYDQGKISGLIQALDQKLDYQPVFPRISLGRTNNPQSLSLNPGKNILGIDKEKTEQKTIVFLNENSSFSTVKNQESADYFSIYPETIWLSKTLTEDEKLNALEVAEKLVGKEIVFSHDVIKKTLNDQDLISFLTFPSGFVDELINDEIISWKEGIDRPSQNAKFEFDKNSFEVTEFAPHRDGLVLGIDETKEQIKKTVEDIISNEDEEKISYEENLSLITSSPEMTLEKTNNLGIKERIGFGESFYAHSISSRIHNVAITADKINYSIVAPGKEFSFNKTLGDVSSATGYKPAYVIKDGATVLGDGGGVCQVSTTLFRSLLDAGLEITLRLPHSYRVSYYELDHQPGFDATVYSGNVDLRFINDSDSYVLIYTETDSNNLYMKVELYGTSDGRTTEISNYKSWDFRGPLEPIYVPDPSLPTGRTKQIDWAASGIKAQFTHTIRDSSGEIIREKVYYSNYRPWAAKYLQGV